MKKLLLILTLAALAVPVRSAYKGHADDRDVAALLAAHPALAGTPADSCVTCHLAGNVSDPAAGGRLRDVNHCDFCHAVHVRDGGPVGGTLNVYGRAYREAGRSPDAVRALSDRDADGDGASNRAELTGGTNPGDRTSHPSAAVAPARTVPLAAAGRLVPIVTEAVFLNSTKSRSGDSYNQYRGYRLHELLRGVGLSTQARVVDLLSLDGYETTFTLEEIEKAWPQSEPVPGLGRENLGACGWVNYHAAGSRAGAALRPAHILLALEENGRPLPKARIDPVDGRITGSGPLRVIVPQFQPSPPDIGQRADPDCASRLPPVQRFHDEYDHNAGRSNSAIVAIRVRPLPEGTREPSWQTLARGLVEKEELLIFGALR